MGQVQTLTNGRYLEANRECGAGVNDSRQDSHAAIPDDQVLV